MHKLSARKKSPLKLVTKQADWKQIEEWARTAVASGGDDRERQYAFLLLLDEMTRSNEANSIAIVARNAAFGGAESIIDDVMERTLAPLRERRAS